MISAQLPSGTVTFLFTDIEGNAQLWEREPEPMRQALARHDGILRAAVEAHHGHLYKTIGDAIQAAFVLPSAALGAAEAVREAASRPMLGYKRVEYGRQVAALRAALDPARLDEAWAAGNALDMDQAIADALRES